MSGYLLRRLLGMAPTFLGIIALSFGMMHLAPGKPTDAITDLNIKISLQARERLVQLYGLDRPVHEQFFRWAARTLKGDFGQSFKDGRPVLEKVLERVPLTLTINGIAMLLVLAIAIPIGVAGAAREGSLIDHALTLFVFIGFALPGFWFALLALELFGVRLEWFPVSGLQSLGVEQLPWGERLLDCARHLAIPIGVMVFGGLAGISRYVRSQMLDQLSQDYVRTARAKGLSERAVLYRHALRNALLPLITIRGLSIPGLLGGSVILESIFALPGMGRLFFDAVSDRDYPVIMALLVLGAVLTLLGNFRADLCYAAADPRIRYGEER